MMHEPAISTPLTNAMYDFGTWGVVMLILACGVLVLAFTRDWRSAISTTLGIAFVAVASGWVFQVAAQRQAAEEHRAAAEQAERKSLEAFRAQEEPAMPAADTTESEWLRIGLDEESADVAVFQVSGRLADDTKLVDQVIEAACPGCRFSLATDGKRIYSRKEGSDQTVKSFVLSEHAVQVTFKQVPENEQLDAVGEVVQKLATAAKLQTDKPATWRGSGFTRTLPLTKVAAAPAPSTPARTSPVITWDRILNLPGRQPAAKAEGSPPEWIALADQSGQLVEGTYVKVASSGRFLTVDQCQPSLNEAINQEVRNYVRLRLGPEAERIVAVPQKLIDEQIVYGPIAEETIASSTVEGGGKRLHALLVFDQKVQEDLKSLYREAQVQHRSLLAIALAAAVVLVLAAVYGYLKLDALTEHKYSGRLQAAALLVMGLAGAAALWAVRVLDVL
jgi:hypothetical protein